MGVSNFRCFGATERAVWTVGRAGTAAPSGWIVGPQLSLIWRLSDRPGATTYLLMHVDQRRDLC
eukprot:1728548-Alexandrium_andersonii.AAC.1